MSANGTRAEALQEQIDRLGGDIRDVALKITTIGEKITTIGENITTIGNDIRGLYGNKEEEGRVEMLKVQLAEAKAQQAEAKAQQAVMETQKAELKALLKSSQDKLAKLESAGINQRRTRGFSKEEADRLKGLLYGVLNEEGNPCGVAFFIAPNRALTLQSEDVTVKVHVVSFDEKYDYAVLVPEDPKFSSFHLTIGAVPELYENPKCTLLTWYVALADELRDLDFKPSFTMHHEVRLMKTSPHRVAFNASTFDGDSGGALILTETCEVIGMHAETVNRTRELKRQKEVENRLESIEDSVESLINGLNSGALGIRLDKFNFF